MITRAIKDTSSPQETHWTIEPTEGLHQLRIQYPIFTSNYLTLKFIMHFSSLMFAILTAGATLSLAAPADNENAAAQLKCPKGWKFCGVCFVSTKYESIFI